MKLVGGWVSSCRLSDVRQQRCRVQDAGGGWQREDACFELSCMQGTEEDSRLDEKCLAWCVCVVGVKSREGDKQSWGLGPGGKVGWEGWLEGGVLVLVLVQVSGGRWTSYRARARARRVPQPPGSCRICRL